MVGTAGPACFNATGTTIFHPVVGTWIGIEASVKENGGCGGGEGGSIGYKTE